MTISSSTHATTRQHGQVAPAATPPVRTPLPAPAVSPQGLRRLLLAQRVALALLGGAALAIVAWQQPPSPRHRLPLLALVAVLVAAALVIALLAYALRAQARQLHAATAQLARVVEARDEFLGIASHELKTPLTALKLHLELGAQLLPEKLAGGAPPWLLGALRSLRRLETLAAQLLDVTRIRAGRLVLDPREICFSDLVARVAERLEPEVVRRGGTLALDLPPRVTGSCDPDRLDQVLTNLVSNAVKHAPGSPVAIRLSERGDRVVFEVRDGGPGLPPGCQRRIFEPFERASPSPTSVDGGLGLYIVKQIVEAHGGRVHAESAPGCGAAFVVDLPRAAAPPPGPR
jgi:signal transduction histidine kinase